MHEFRFHFGIENLCFIEARVAVMAAMRAGAFNVVAVKVGKDKDGNATFNVVGDYVGLSLPARFDLFYPKMRWFAPVSK